jgi:para-nitrobenzyl esterase
VIAESGALSLLHSPTSARATTDQFVKLAGVTDVAGLLALTQAQLLDAEQKLFQSTSFSDLLFGPVIDGVVVTEPPLHAIARGDAAGTPLLTGTTHDETKYWYFYDEWLAGVPPRDGAKLLPFVSDLFDGPSLEALIEGYEARSPTASPGDITMQLATDALFRQPQIRLAEAHAAHEPRTYMYLFDWRTPIEDGLYGSPHSVELPFVFRTFGEPSVDNFVGKSPPIRLADAVEDAWIAFVRGQAPSSPLLQDWRPYDQTRRATMRLDVASVVEDDPLGADRQAWQAIAFDSVSPAI